MSSANVLIVEDDRHIAKLVKYNLEKAGYACKVVITGEEALELLDREPADLVILDVMLPKMDGFETCRRIKQDSRLASMPLMMLTARGEEVDRVVGLELGADDYMVKPFSPRELTLRVKAILRRHKPKESVKEIIQAGPIRIDIPRHKVTAGKKDLSLSPMEFRLLVALIQGGGRVLSRELLLDQVWGISADVTTRTVDTHVKLLRQKLGKAAKWIETIRGVGYRFLQEDD